MLLLCPWGHELKDRAKKNELVGDFKNAGRELRPKGQPARVRTHDFKDKDLGKVAPYGVYDLAHDEALVSVGLVTRTRALGLDGALRAV